jgi:hypothetical protein
MAGQLILHDIGSAGFLRLYVDEKKCDVESREYQGRLADGEIGFIISTPAFFKGTNYALVIIVYEDMEVMQTFFFQDIYQEFKSNTLKPPDVAEGVFP